MLNLKLLRVLTSIYLANDFFIQGMYSCHNHYSLTKTVNVIKCINYVNWLIDYYFIITTTACAS